CTMKHNPRLNEKLARLPGLADIHPLQPISTVPGALELIDILAHWLKTLTGMPAVALSPAAGAHGERCGMLTIRADLEASGGGRVLLLRRRQFHRDRWARAAGRSRHRLHAHQPAQDIFDAAWRRRSGKRPGGSGRQPRSLRAPALDCARAERTGACRAQERRG